MDSGSSPAQRIIVDAMGGDHAPREVVLGAIEAVRFLPHLQIILVGRREEVERVLQSAGFAGDAIYVVDAPQVIGMEEHPVEAIRSKKDSSLVTGLKMVAEGEGDAFVSAGNTGACLAASLGYLQRIRGVLRPAIAVTIPRGSPPLVLLDAGANADCRPEFLAQFAVMGKVYYRSRFGVQEPKIGLINIGEEETKGSSLYITTYGLLKESDINFVGNVEGRDLFGFKADVVVADGFIGNVIIKTIEGTASMILSQLKEKFTRDLRSKLGSLALLPALREVKRSLDYEEYGGALLLGLNGVVIVGHGSSRAKAVRNSIKVAVEMVQEKTVEKIAKEMEKEVR